MSRTDNRLINIKYKDGRVARIPRRRADPIVDSGRAHYISNTLYREATRSVKETKAEITEKQSKKAADRRKKKAEKAKKESSDE